MSRGRLSKALDAAHARQDKTGAPFAIILFSIDRFRLLNHRFGHAAANGVLRRVRELARRVIGRHGTVGRWGSDEFLCILPGCGRRDTAAHARALAEAVQSLIVPGGSELVNVTASLGTACAPDDGTSVQELLNAADEALYEAKRTGRDRIVAAHAVSRRVFQMGALLEAALREDRVAPAYQPIIDLASGRLAAEEALARIVTVDGRVLAADEFIEAASQFRLTYRIDWTVLLSAFQRLRDRKNTIPVFVNISGDLLRHPHLLRELQGSARQRSSAGREYALPFVIEVTERELLDNLELTRERLAPFLEDGFQLALDDFGSGYSSFQYLADLPVSYLKIDGRLITRLQEPKVLSIVRGIQSVADDLGIITLAEYVESAEQAERLRQVGIRWGQGHHFGVAEVDQSVADQRRALSVNWAQGYYYQKVPLLASDS